MKLFLYICIQLYISISISILIYAIIAPSSHHLVLLWLSSVVLLGFLFRKDVAFSCKDSRSLTVSNCSTIKSCLSIWDETIYFLCRPPPMTKSSGVTKAGHFCPMWSFSNGKLITESLLAWWPVICQMCEVVSSSFCSSCSLPFFCLCFRSALHSEVFPYAIWLPLSFSITGTNYNNLSEYLCLSQGLLPKVLNWHKLLVSGFNYSYNSIPSYKGKVFTIFCFEFWCMWQEEYKLVFCVFIYILNIFRFRWEL